VVQSINLKGLNMNDIILSKYDAIEQNLVQLYALIGKEMGECFHDQDGDEYKTLVNQLLEVKRLLNDVRFTLKQFAPELYPDF
jgi:hypothetical protein